jgi:hypothetical protein
MPSRDFTAGMLRGFWLAHCAPAELLEAVDYFRLNSLPMPTEASADRDRTPRWRRQARIPEDQILLRPRGNPHYSKHKQNMFDSTGITYIDDKGLKVTKLPPGFAIVARPSLSAKGVG